MKINLLRPNNTTITLDVSKIDAISGIVDGKFNLYAGDLTYTISASEYTKVSNVLGTASSSSGGGDSGMEVVYTTERDLTLEPNKYYIFGECSTLDINIGEPITNGKLNEYRFEFDSGATPTVLTLSNTVNPSTLNILENTKYVISIKNNVLTEVGSEYSDTSSFLRNILNKTITSIVIPEGVTLIPPYAFYLCRLLISVTLPSTILEIGAYAFYLCDALVSINLPEGLMVINNYAFYQCTALTNIILPSTLTFIGNNTFNGCTVLLSPVFPSSLRTIDTNAFLACKNLSSIVLPTGLPTIWANTFYGCSGLNSVTIPNTVVTLGGFCFCGCSALSSILLPNSVATILQQAFDGCGALKEILMYDSVISITGSYVFRGINGSCRIRIYGTTNIIPFLTNAPATVKFYVDPTMVQAYKTNSAWSARASYIYSLNDYVD